MTVSMFSSTVMLAKSFRSWNDRPIPSRAILQCGRPRMDLPSQITLPRSGTTCPVIKLNSVVLPAPFGPTSVVMMPARSANETSSTAFNPPKVLATPVACSRISPPLLMARRSPRFAAFPESPRAPLGDRSWAAPWPDRRRSAGSSRFPWWADRANSLSRLAGAK